MTLTDSYLPEGGSFSPLTWVVIGLLALVWVYAYRHRPGRGTQSAESDLSWTGIPWVVTFVATVVLFLSGNVT